MSNCQILGTDNNMLISHSRNRLITAPTISTNTTTCVYMRSYELIKNNSRSIRYMLKTNSPYSLACCGYLALILNSNYYQSLIFSTATLLARTFAANVSLVDFNGSGQVVTIWPYHCASQSMQPSPSRVIAAQIQSSLQAQRIGSVFLVCNVPHRLKPKAQRFSRIVKKSAGSYRGLAITLTALKQSSRSTTHFLTTAYRALKSVRPAQGNEIVNTRLLCREALSEFSEVLWEILHTPILHIVVSGVKCIATFYYSRRQ